MTTAKSHSPARVPPDILKKVRRIQIVTSALVQDVFAGQYHSAFKGLGMAFEDVRAYQPGDDVRTIDWNVTARTGQPFVKTYREERELTVVLLVDISPSQDFGTRGQLKSELVAELGATLAFSAIENNDKVGLILFTDRVERFVPARKGIRHVLRVTRELLYHQPAGRGTNVGAALECLSRVFRRRAVVFLISDFQAPPFEEPLRVARHRHDVIPVLVRDERETTLPPVGYVELSDPETGEQVLIDTRSRPVRERFSELAEERRQKLLADLRRLQIDTLEISTGRSFVVPLQQFFRRRERRR